MAGIYIHVPFCKQRCHYCDFYKTTQLLKQPELVQALVSELEIQSKHLQYDEVETIYFGGGTPSVLSQDELEHILGATFANYNVVDEVEITLEANPDDLSEEKLAELADLPINRLSMGIQSFQDEQLKLMNRRHMAQQAIDAVKNAQAAGFDNISTDLIYGLPGLSPEAWQADLEQMAALNIQHMSAYHLTYEPGTQFDNMLKNGALQPLGEEESLEQFKMLIQWAKAQGFEHYEISNFALPGMYSRHNTSYWQQKKYLGIGPSAHSYDLRNRWWNVSSLNKYLKGIEQEDPAIESETLSVGDKFNEYIMTALRTKWGISKERLLEHFGEGMTQMLAKAMQPFMDNHAVKEENEHYILTDEGIFISDAILSELVFV